MYSYSMLGPATPELELDALLTLGRELAMQGSHREAERTLTRAARLASSAAPALKGRALGSLGTFYARQGRRFEALLLYRASAALAAEAEDVLLELRHLSNIGAMFTELQQPRHLPPLIGRVDTLVAGFDPAQREVAEELVLWLRWHAALAERQQERCQALFTKVRAYMRRYPDPSNQALLAMWEADILLGEGLATDALALLEQSTALPASDPGYEAHIGMGRIECLRALGRSVDARREALTLLTWLEDLGLSQHLAAWRAEAAAELGAHLEVTPGDPSAAMRAYDLAASDTLARMSQLAACEQRLREFVDLDREARLLLSSLESGFLAQHREVLVRVSGVLGGSTPDQSPIPTQRIEGAMAANICAWCGFAGTHLGGWIPISQAIRRAALFKVTHGICPDCMAEELDTLPDRGLGA